MRLADSQTTRALPRGWVVAALLLLVARVAGGLYEKQHPSKPWSRVAWVPLEEAEALARESRKHIVYNFSAEWCEPCHVMDRELFSDETAAADINARYIPVKVMDVTQEEGENPPAVEALLRKHNPGVFPTLLIVSPDGKEVAMRRGYGSYTETLKFLRLPTPSGRRAPPPRRPTRAKHALAHPKEESPPPELGPARGL